MSFNGITLNGTLLQIKYLTNLFSEKEKLLLVIYSHVSFTRDRFLSFTSATLFMQMIDQMTNTLVSHQGTIV